MFDYFSGKIHAGFVAIYSARMILRISSALLGLFLPIFLYELFELRIEYVIYYYLIAHLLYAFTVAWGCQHLNNIGLRRSLRISVVVGAIYYLVFFIIGRNTAGLDWLTPLGSYMVLLLVITIILLTINRVMYWIPVHTDMAKFTDKRNRARQLSLLEATTLVLGAIGPVVAGWILLSYSYDVLFLIAIIIYLAALIPFMSLPRTKERFSWSYKITWQEFLSLKRRGAVFAYMADGGEHVVGLVIWPIFIYELLNGNYFEIGALTSLVVIATIIIQLLAGEFADGGDKRKILRWGSAFYALGWVLKIFIITPFQIFIVSTYHSLAKIFTKTPFDALSYEKAADHGHYVDEYTVIHEMAFHFGKAAMLSIILLFLSILGFKFAFVLAALASLGMNLMAGKRRIASGRGAS